MAGVDNLTQETTQSVGTGTLTIAIADGKQTFNAAFGTGGTDVFYYFISHREKDEWEVGTGHLSTSTTLVRDTVIDSSNAASLVVFTHGTKDVTNDLPASFQQDLADGDFIRHDGTIDFTGTQQTLQINPVSDNAYDMGISSLAYREMWGNRLRIFEGDGTLIVPPVTEFVKQAAVIATALDGSGTSIIEAVHLELILPGVSAVIGTAVGDIGSTGTSAIRSTGVGSFAGGAAIRFAGSTGDSTMAARTRGAFAWGNSALIFSGGSSEISAGGAGAFATGYIQAVFSNQAHLISASTGAFAGGNITVASDVGPTLINAAGAGSYAHGSCADDGTIEALGAGGVANGDVGISATLRSGGAGSAALGCVSSNKTIETLAAGSLVGGLASSFDILMSSAATGGIAWGDADTGNIEANASNAAQLGPGVNNQQDSAQIGNAGVRLLATTTAPTTPQAGDIRVDSSSDMHLGLAGNNIVADGGLTTTEGRLVGKRRITTSSTQLATDHHVFCNGTLTYTLLAGVDRKELRIVNTGSVTVTIAPDGLENLLGANASFDLAPGEVLIIVYDTTDGWY